MADPAPFNAAAMLQYIQTLVAGLSGLQQTYIGAPESIATRVNAFVTIGDTTPRPKANQLAQRNPEVMVTFAYRVAGAEQNAELTVCSLVDELTMAVYADRTLGGTSQSAELNMGINREPAYMDIGASEVRRYVVLITGLQTASTP